MSQKNPKILLTLLPFWAPLIPPLGISCLKSFLEKHNYNVKTIDVNLEYGIWDIYENYMNTLGDFIPEEKKGNLHMIGHDVYMDHMMGCFNFVDEDEYVDLIKELVNKNFFIKIEDLQAIKLNKIIDQFYFKLKKYLETLFETEIPDILGMSVYNSNLAPSLFAAKLAKEIDPDMKTVMGGGIFADHLSYNSPNYKKLLEKAPYIDKIIIGEGELLFLKYLQGKLPETQKTYTINDINGKILDINSTTKPDFSDLQINSYPHLATYTSRSCPYQCNFCSETIHWGKYRKKNAAKAVEEMIQLHKAYKRQLFFLCDSIINPIITKLSQEMIKQDLSLYWDGYIRADKPVCNPDNTILWRKGGFYRARLGIESGSQKILNAMNKKTNITQIKKAITSLANAGTKTTTYWVVGYPGETESDFQQTLNLVEELSDHIYEADIHPFIYFLSGQVKSDKLYKEHGASPLYSKNAQKMLIAQTWVLNSKPSRDEVYDRLNRFAKLCKELTIPNPYSLRDIDIADERWADLHKNAVPALTELYNNNEYITENKKVKKILITQEKHAQDSVFNF